MATVRLTDVVVGRLEPPATGNKITYDAPDKKRKDWIPGFGVRVTAAGHKAFVLGYTVRGSGRQRRFTIGGCNHWTTTDARAEAARLRVLIDQGGDPLADIEAEREAPDMAALVARFREEHFPRLRANTSEDYGGMLRNYVLPHFSERMKVADVRFEDIDALHRKITKAGHLHRANRCVALLSKMFALAIHWKMRSDNPAKGIKRNREHARRRYMKANELARIVEALAKFPDQDIADAIRLLLLTGARRNEVLTMKWTDVDLTAGTWSKPPVSVKQDEHHQVPLSAPARQLLADRMARKADSEYVFPGCGGNDHRVDFWLTWQKLCKAAGVAGLRVHDLRHSFASELVSSGASLPLIGSLLGHRNPATTARYSHLYADAQLAAVERVGATVSNAGKPAAEPVPLRGRSRTS
jgi:integrase